MNAHSEAGAAPPPLGMFKGVFVPTMCSTLGVVVFLRMGFVVGQAGFGLAVLMVCLGFTIASLTMRSLIELLGGDGEGDGDEGNDSATGVSAPTGGTGVTVNSYLAASI